MIDRNFSRTSILKKGIISQRQATDRSARRTVTMNLENSSKDLLGGTNRSNQTPRSIVNQRLQFIQGFKQKNLHKTPRL